VLIAWISRHASAIILIIITIVLTKYADELFSKRPKVIAFVTHGAQFGIGTPANPNAMVNTFTLGLQNLGRAVAEDIQITHSYLPANIQVWPPAATTVVNLPSNHRVLTIPSIAPRQIVFVAYLDMAQINPGMIVHMTAKGQPIRLVQAQISKMYSRRTLYVLTFLLALGVVTAAWYAYLWGTALVRFLPSVSK
jgi:hypothetical protein